jgi:glycine dehydrogenase subunit 2
MKKDVKLIFEMSVEGRRAYSLDACDVPEKEIEEYIPSDMLRSRPAALPEVSEVDVVRHFTELSQENYGVDAGFYPLGSCTMKYNPKVNEDIAAMPGFACVHPQQDASTVQGCLEVMYDTSEYLAKITGMQRVSLQPAAGAHGELTGLMIIKAYHRSRGDTARTKILVPDSAHGTNPASAMCAGFEVVAVSSDERGNIDLDSLRAAAGSDTAGLMLTNPNTLGFFDDHIAEVADIIHKAGGLLYYDGANLNAVVGYCRPGDMGFDVVHLNLHKTFSTPHGGGGPGSGPVGVKKALEPFLPRPLVVKKDGAFALDYDRPQSIGQVRSFYGNFGVVLKAWAYILTMGDKGLAEVSRAAVLNANYVRVKLAGKYKLPYDRALHARGRLLGRQSEGARRLDARRRKTAARLRLPSADSLFPAYRPRGHDGRADRDREQGNARRIYRGHARHSAGGRGDAGQSNRRALHHRLQTLRRDARRAYPDTDLLSVSRGKRRLTITYWEA